MSSLQMSNSEANKELTGSQPAKSGLNSQSESNRETHVFVKGLVETIVRVDFADIKTDYKEFALDICDIAFSKENRDSLISKDSI